ncbi:MAG: VIT1/CCC1 transporter family protein [SAR202 cluster bacterium]|nr:VIT1/CCC1 transporter family protein [SAR202 cluster bacterium]MDP6716073.1 VIT1/CCC1 transporter family protein [SAR202 cluster bacterium]
MIDERRYQEYLKSELEAAATYEALANAEQDEDRASAFRALMEGELRHAARWAEKLGLDSDDVKPSSRGLRVWTYQIAARLFGTSRVIPWLLKSEARELRMYANEPEASDLAPEEQEHARVLRTLGSNGDSGSRTAGNPITGFIGGGNLRAAILGVNDGLVSNFSLVMGVAGGTDNADFILLAGVAGLLAGAFSMAAGEYVSVRSQRDVYEHQIKIEAGKLQEWPEEEKAAIAQGYQDQGLTPEEANIVAERIMAQPELALDTKVRGDLGLDPNYLGSPWGAAMSSFVAFVIGAVVPIIPYVFSNAPAFTVATSAVLSAIALLLVGGVVAANSGRSVVWGGFRMFLAGGFAAAITYGVGSAIGVAVTG